MNSAFEFRKSRELGDILNGTFTFVRQNWKPLGRAVFIYAAPFAFLGGAFGGMGQADLSGFSAGYEYRFDNLTKFVANFSLLGVFLFAAAVMMAAVVYQYIRIYLENGGNEVSSQNIWEAMKPVITPYLGYLLASTLIMMVGFVFCIIPGIYLAIPLSMIIAVKTFENRTLGEAISRCFYLAKNYWWQTFLVLFVVNLITGIAGAAASLPFTIISTVVSITSIESGEGAGLMARALLIASSVISYGVSSLLGVLTMIATALQYFNLVERKEGVGAMQRLDQLGKTAEANDSEFEESY